MTPTSSNTNKNKASAGIASLFCAAVALIAPSFSAQAAGSLQVYVSAPAVSTETYSGAQTEPFTSFAAGNFTTLASTGISGSSYSGTGASIINGGIYAASTGAGNYLAIANGGRLTLTLNAAVPYFSLALSAVDGNNNLSFYDTGGALIGTFNAADVTNLLPNTAGRTVTANNGSTYNTTAYYGQPNTATPPVATTNNPNEAYAFLHFFGQDGTTIKSIVFEQKGGGNLESDNHSILSTAPAVDGTFVRVGSVVPEPGVGLMVAAGCVGLLTIRRLRRVLP